MQEVYFNMWQKILFGSPKLLAWILEKYDFNAKEPWKVFSPRIIENAHRETIEAIQRAQVAADPQREYDNMRELGMDILPITARDYPENLKNLSVPPVSLYYKGSLKCATKPCIAIVGTRKISSYGRKTVRKLIEELSSYDITIISGLAYGIDAHAHTLSTESSLTNIAVLANGLDKLYPEPHTNLAANIIKKGGAVISEAPPFVPAEKFMFPIRNRIIAGLAHAVVVAEAPRKSGALITANYAFHENRLVYAIPGDITDYRQEGCHNLIKSEQAVLLTDASQIIGDLKLTTLNLTTKAKEIAQNQVKILNLLDRTKPVHIEKITGQTGIPARKLVGQLMELEIAGHIKNIGAMRYIRT